MLCSKSLLSVAAALSIRGLRFTKDSSYSCTQVMYVMLGHIFVYTYVITPPIPNVLRIRKVSYLAIRLFSSSCDQMYYILMGLVSFSLPFPFLLK